MNPIRQRIFQYFLLHETGTVKELKKAFSDIPNASLYRHIKILADHSILIVVGENRIRGTVESVYRLNKDALATEDESGNAVQMSLLSICASFARYFAGGKADPKRDMLLLTNCTLLLTDESMTIADVAAQVGYTSTLTFTRAFKARYHMTPGEYRRLHASD